MGFSRMCSPSVVLEWHFSDPDAIVLLRREGGLLEAAAKAIDHVTGPTILLEQLTLGD